jgi:hypothetical protein
MTEEGDDHNTVGHVQRRSVLPHRVCVMRALKSEGIDAS